MKKIYLLTSLTIGVFVLASCGKGGSRDSKTINIFMNEGNNFTGITKDSIWKKMEKDVGLSINISGASHGDDYYSNLNLQLQKPASFKYDIVFTVPSNNEAHYQEHVDDDLYWNIDELLAMKPGKYPYIEKIIHSEKYKNIQYCTDDGFIHSLIPYGNSDNDWAIYYRSDWLINVGFYDDVDGKKVARVPTTLTEFSEVLKRFSLNDPDKDPSTKTYGISPAGSFFYWSPLYHAFGVTPDYDVNEKKKITYMYTQPEFKEFLGWANDMYSKGYIDPNFSANVPNDGDRTKFYNGEVGILITNGLDHVSWIIPETEKIQGKDKIVVGPAPLGDKDIGKEGVGGFSNWGGWWGGYSIFKRHKGSSFDTKAAFNCMDFLEYIYSPEGGMIRNYGIEGTHFEKQGDKIIPLFDGRNNEPDKTFTKIKQEDGSSKLSGFYRMGHAFGNRFNWIDDDNFEVMITNENVDYELKTYFEKTVKNNFTVSSKLLNFTSYASGFDGKMNLFEDELDTYANAVVRGLPNTLSWEQEMTRLNNVFFWEDIQDMIKEQAMKAGIIK